MTPSPRLAVALVVLVIGGFVFVALQKITTVPVHEIDEAYTLQVPYEILNRGKLALPMYRFLGGNIENVWHSLTPLFFLILSGYLKVVGFGVPQGRIFNLITVVLTLWMVYLLGKRLVDSKAGLIAVALITSDQTVLERSSLLRNDYIAEALALLAFYVYELAERRKQGKLYVASGLIAGAGVMCHTSILYMLAAICLLMLLTEGRRIFKARKLYQFLAGAFVVMSYEIVYDLIDFKNLLLQYRGDDYHFGILSLSGWWANLLDEPTRYIRWYTAYDVTFHNVPKTLLHLFQALSVAAILYLIIRCIGYIKRGNALAEPRVRLLIVTATMLMFFANIAHKSGYYNAHLVTWFGLCVGVMFSDLLSYFESIRLNEASKTRLVYRLGVACTVIAVLLYVSLLVRQQRSYIKEVRNPSLASFQEFESVIRSVIPSELCPVAVKSPVMWLAFPDKDRCFANIERRMAPAVDIDGKDYALIVRPKNPDYWAKDLNQRHHLLGELTDTPYGNFLIYYTGIDERYSAEPKRYHFFRRWSGHVRAEQVAQAPEVWSATGDDLKIYSKQESGSLKDAKLKPRANDSFTELSTIELKPATAYQLLLDSNQSEGWELVLADVASGSWLKQINLDDEDRIDEIFRTLESKRVRLLVRGQKSKASDSLLISRISIREVGGL